MRLLILSLAGSLCLAVAGEPLRFVDGVPVGGPPPMASAIEWTIGHYAGVANTEVFAATPGKKLEYVINLAGRQSAITWADRIVLSAAGRTPASCLMLSDGDPARRAATVEAWISDGPDAHGAAAFALGIDGASGAFSQRGRTDLSPQRAQPVTCPSSGFPGEIATSVLSTRENGRLVPQIGVWEAFWVAGDAPRLVAGQQRSLRFMQKIASAAIALPGPWGCLIVSGFPSTAKAPEAAVMPFVAWRLTTKAGERLVLIQTYMGPADAVENLGVTSLHDDGKVLDRSGERWSWNGADWQAAPVWNARSEATYIAVKPQP